MHRHAQGHGTHGAKAGGVADWQALEVQLNRTRAMLQEILVHLQEVLKNLRSARNGGPAAAGRPGAEQARSASARDNRFRAQATPPPGASTRDNRFRAQSTPPPGASDRFSRTQAQGPTGQTASSSAGASERNRFKARPNFEAAGPAGNGQTAGSAQQRAAGFGQPAGDEKARAGYAGTNRAGQSTFRTAAGQSGAQRERPRQESTFRAKAAGPDPAAGARASGQQSRTTAGSAQGAHRTSAQGPTAGASRPYARPRPERPTGGFCQDDARQHRAREVARKNGMNLKCAYDILCINYPCTVDEIKNAYRHMARRHHPDLGGDEEAMKDVNVAYELAMRFSAGRRTAAAWAV